MSTIAPVLDCAADTPTCHATANVARLKHYANETGATVMVAPVVFT